MNLYSVQKTLNMRRRRRVCGSTRTGVTTSLTQVQNSALQRSKFTENVSTLEVRKSYQSRTRGRGFITQGGGAKYGARWTSGCSAVRAPRTKRTLMSLQTQHVKYSNLQPRLEVQMFLVGSSGLSRGPPESSWFWCPGSERREPSAVTCGGWMTTNNPLPW